MQMAAGLQTRGAVTLLLHYCLMLATDAVCTSMFSFGYPLTASRQTSITGMLNSLQKIEPKLADAYANFNARKHTASCQCSQNHDMLRQFLMHPHASCKVPCPLQAISIPPQSTLADSAAVESVRTKQKLLLHRQAHAKSGAAAQAGGEEAEVF